MKTFINQYESSPPHIKLKLYHAFLKLNFSPQRVEMQKVSSDCRDKINF